MMNSSRRNDIEARDTAPREREDDAVSPIPLVERFPRLASVGRRSFGTYPTPVMSVDLRGVRAPMWIKRDDLDARGLPGLHFAGGNKLRALEFLLAPVAAGDTVLALGGEGSTHVLATVALAHAIGARVVAVRWPQDMNPVARRVAERVAALADEDRPARSVASALGWAWWRSRSPRVHRLPAGGASPLGMLGAVNAALELAGQVSAGELERPARVVLPLGTGATAAGLALGFALAGLDARVVGVRVTPRIVANRWHVRRLAGRCARLIARVTGRPVALPAGTAVEVDIVHGWYGGAYGRALPAARPAQDELERTTGLTLDDTYGAKAFAAALELARTRGGPTLFWRTFDPRSPDP